MTPSTAESSRQGDALADALCFHVCLADKPRGVDHAQEVQRCRQPGRTGFGAGLDTLSRATSPRECIFFANVQHFRRELYAALDARDPKPSIVVIDASRRYLFEFTAHEAVREMIADLREQGFEIWGVLPRGGAGEAIRRFRQDFGPGEVQLFPTLSDAIETHLDQLDGPAE